MSVKKIRILLVDDHTVARSGVRLMLNSAHDIEVVAEAEDAHTALRIAQTNGFDVALVDIALPDKNGLELLRLLRAEHKKLAVLVLSMYSEEVYALRAFKLGASGYLSKTSPAAVLETAIRKAAAGSRYISPTIAEKFVSMISGEALTSFEALSDRELEVLKLIASGESLVRIADTLHLSASTVTTYRRRILEKIGLSTNSEMAQYARQNGLLM
ncbi:response regulator transcription factor [Noviherbaspirillum saxi]|uniref:DNA-binding response regulator n=1 Tax=Noviherbaspirillum saxi TaxID=2320863 RepID=A0A3A3FI10_9BURK|nr:response regulator transcription factor [Noviherbaspirillum saxi]RJF95148.1 DNA-binding response regulator [Noviherbaspirillum saxi]